MWIFSRGLEKSGNAKEDPPHGFSLPAPTARYLVDCGVMTVGVDYLSVGGHNKDGVECHQIMLGARQPIWIVEGLNLAKIKPGKYELACLPLKIVGADGTPCRAALRVL